MYVLTYIHTSVEGGGVYMYVSKCTYIHTYLYVNTHTYTRARQHVIALHKKYTRTLTFEFHLKKQKKNSGGEVV